MILPRNDEPLEEYKDYKNNKFETVKNKIKHILKLTNCWQLQPIYQNIVFNANNSTTKERTSSFDIELIKMEEEGKITIHDTEA